MNFLRRPFKFPTTLDKVTEHSMIRFGRVWIAFLVSATCCAFPSQPAMAQVDFLKSLLGGRQQPQQATFQGHPQLAQSIEQAEKGDLKASFKFAREAFQDRGAKELFNDVDSRMIAPSLLRLSKLWIEKNAPPVEVAEFLREVVVPLKPAGRAFLFPAQSQLTFHVGTLNRQGSRWPAPESVGAELVRWSVLAKQTEELKKRLQPVLAGDRAKEGAKDEKGTDKKEAVSAVTKFDTASARIIAVQLAVAETDVESANKLLKALIDDAKPATEQRLDDLCHAVSAALQEPKLEAAGLALLEAIVDQAQQALPVESSFRMNAPWLRIRAAELHARVGRTDDAKRYALASISKPMNASRFGADYATYLDHVLKQQAAAALLDAGAIAEGLDVATITPDARALRYNQGSNSINMAVRAARELRKLAPAERFEFLRKWALPNESSDLLRMLGAFTPTHPAPPVLNENPIDVATAEARQAVDQRLVQIGGNFVCPEILLVLAAAEIDRLDELKEEVFKHPPTSSPEMARFVQQLHGQALYLIYGGVPEEFGSQPKTTQWRTVSQPTAKSRGDGYPIASFDVIAGEIAQRGGHEFDGAYFQSPRRVLSITTARQLRGQLPHFAFRLARADADGVGNRERAQVHAQRSESVTCADSHRRIADCEADYAEGVAVA